MDNNNTQIFCQKLNNLFDTTAKSSMIHECTMHLEDKKGDFIWSKEYGGIHIYKGKDYSDEITVGNLLFQSTGLPDVYAAENNNLNKKMRHGDFHVSFEEYVRIARENRKKFAPGTSDKAWAYFYPATQDCQTCIQIFVIWRSICKIKQNTTSKNSLS